MTRDREGEGGVFLTIGRARVKAQKRNEGKKLSENVKWCQMAEQKVNEESQVRPIQDASKTAC